MKISPDSEARALCVGSPFPLQMLSHIVWYQPLITNISFKIQTKQNKESKKQSEPRQFRLWKLLKELPDPQGETSPAPGKINLHSSVHNNNEMYAHQFRPVAKVFLNQFRSNYTQERSRSLQQEKPIQDRFFWKRGSTSLERLAQKWIKTWFATAFASNVLPVPGGPYKITPFGGLMPISSYNSGWVMGSSTAENLNQISIPSSTSHYFETCFFNFLDLGLQSSNISISLQRRFINLNQQSII